MNNATDTLKECRQGAHNFIVAGGTSDRREVTIWIFCTRCGAIKKMEDDK